MDPRKILGVDDQASKDDIQRAYRRQAKKHHPDLGGDSWAFQQVQDAYEALSNPQPQTKSKPPTAPQSQTSPRASKTKKRTSPPNPSSAKRSRQSSPRDNAAASRTRRRNKKHPSEERHWWQLIVGELPLQIETMLFIVVNCLDIFLTHKLLQAGAVEANPIANYFFGRWDFNGMIAFKLAIVAVVCVIAQVIALKRFKTAQALLIIGTLLVSAVVVYSIRLYLIHFYY